VELLVKNGVSPNQIGNNNTTPLHYAATCGSIPIINFLINNGANINAIDEYIYVIIIQKHHMIWH